MFALVSSSSRNASVQSSYSDEQYIRAWPRLSQLRGDGKTRHAAGAAKSKDWNTGNIRSKSHLTGDTRASSAGVAIPVEEIVTTVSISRGASPACSIAFLATSTN